MTSVVSAHALQVCYGRSAVIDGLDLEVGPGATALLGPNGAGKTTLLHALSGLRRPSAGSLQVLDVDMTQRPGARSAATRMGFLPQHVGVAGNFTTREFIHYAAWLKKVPKERTPQLIDAALEQVDLRSSANTKLRKLSGGMMRRAAIAAALVHEPEFIMLDEPTVGLDPHQRAELHSLLRRLSERTSLLLSTHLLEDVRAICNNVIILNCGKIEFHGSLAELEAAGSNSLEAGYQLLVSGGAR